MTRTQHPRARNGALSSLTPTTEVPTWLAALLAVLVVLLASPGSALADRGTARLRSGGIVSGDIEVYEPGVRVVIRTASGEVLSLNLDDLVELEIAPEFTGARSAPSARPQAAPVPAQAQAPVPPPAQTTTYIVVPDYSGSAAPYAPAPPAGYQLQQPAAEPPPGRRPSLFWPLMTLSGSAAAFISGTLIMVEGLWSCDYYYGDTCSSRSGQVIGGATLMALSFPLFVLSATFLLPRKVRARRRHRAAVRNYRLSVTPTADARTGHYGVGATLNF